MSFTATVYALVPEGRSSAASISEILAHFPRGTNSGRVRAALMRLSGKGLIIKARQVSRRGGGDPLLFYRKEALTADELTARLRPPRPPRKQQLGKVCPNVLTVVSNWHVDDLGILTRTVTGIDAPEEIIAPMQAAGRAGGLATARGRARKASVVEAEMEAA